MFGGMAANSGCCREKGMSTVDLRMKEQIQAYKREQRRLDCNS
jgi:hypothetical protein